MNYFGTKSRVEFSKSCLKQDKITYRHEKVLNIYIACEISKISSFATLANCLFDEVTLTKNSGIDKYKYSGYGIRFNRHVFYSHLSGETSRNVTIVRVDMSSSTKVDNKKKYILILGKGPTQVLEHT